LVDTSQSRGKNEVIRDVHPPLPSYRKRELRKPRKRWKEVLNNPAGIISEKKKNSPFSNKSDGKFLKVKRKGTALLSKRRVYLPSDTELNVK
jgi:hypothetical protein